MKLNDLIFSNQRSHRLRRHLLFWITWTLYWVTTYLIPTYWIPAWNLHGAMPQIELYGVRISFLRILMNTTLMTVIYMALTYSILYFILPRYLSKNKSWIATTTFLLLLLVALAFINYCFFLAVFSISTHLGYFKKMPDMSFIIPIWARIMLFNYPAVVGFALMIKLLKNWYIKQNEAEQVARENINAELQLLKAEVHPHFLFNTLNNIYSFIINDSPAASYAITRLSTLLRYIIYECDHPLVKLDQELRMLKDYIDLEKIRYGGILNVSLQIQGNPLNKMICPLLLIPFLENSFKHGASQMLTHPWVNLDIIIEDQHLNFNLSNSRPSTNGTNSSTRGLGLRNVKKRLAILYPSDYSLNITEDLMSFNVSLKVPIFNRNQNKKEVVPEEVYELV